MLMTESSECDYGAPSMITLNHCLIVPPLVPDTVSLCEPCEDLLKVTLHACGGTRRRLLLERRAGFLSTFRYKYSAKRCNAVIERTRFYA